MSKPIAAPQEQALRLRERVKKGKPKFARPESWRYVRLKENWRHPRGLDHKVRLHYKGWPAGASSGYGGPKIARGLHPSGYVEVLVCNIEQLAKIETDRQAVRIAHTVGKRKRGMILAEARKKKVIVLNAQKTTETAGTTPKEEEKEGKTEELQNVPRETAEKKLERRKIERRKTEKKTTKQNGRTSAQ